MTTHSYALNDDMCFEATACFIAKGDDQPVTGNSYKARLYDRELFQEDDFIGESGLDADGIAKIRFDAATYKHAPNLGFGGEFYLTVTRNGVEIFRSKVIRDIDHEVMDHYRKGEGEIIDFGTFLIDV